MTMSWAVFIVGLIVSKQVSAEDTNGNQQHKPSVKDSIVKIYTVRQGYSYYDPWKKKIARRLFGSGCVIDGFRILTNAHVVADHRFIQVRRYGETKKYTANILDISHQADLALLTVEDKAFFEDTVPLAFGELPKMQQEVLVYGFPIGGDTLSITMGIVSRIEHRYYSYSGDYFFLTQIDAAVNPGNSGGPVIVEGKIVGIHQQSIKGAMNLGYNIPVPMIIHFLEDTKDGTYDGFPNLGLRTQEMDNSSLREKFQMEETRTGILVNTVMKDSPAQGKIRENDVILTVDGALIANDGTIAFRDEERTNWKYMVDLHQVNDTLRLKVLRDGKTIHSKIVLNKTMSDLLLVPNREYEKPPRYFIFGGLVFSPLTRVFLKSIWGRNWRTKAPCKLVYETAVQPTNQREEVIVIIQVLAAEINKGYHAINYMILETVNGHFPRNLSDLYLFIHHSKEKYSAFANKDNYRIVIDNEQARNSHRKILKRYNVTQDRSIDL